MLFERIKGNANNNKNKKVAAIRPQKEKKQLQKIKL